MADPAGIASWSTVVSIAFGSSVLGTLASKLLDRGGARNETIREGYADAVKALNAWGQYPLRIYRRVDDSTETLARLEALGAEIKESLAYSTGWVGAESSELGRVYNEMVELLRAEVTVHARLAWAQPPASTGARMNIGGPHQPDETADPASGRVPAEWLIVQQFSGLIQYRIGWRRSIWIRPVLRRRIDRLDVLGKARTAFAERSARLLNLPATTPSLL